MYKVFNYQHLHVGDFGTLDQARQALKSLVPIGGYIEYTNAAKEIYRAATDALKYKLKKAGE